jgi:hypothetical protein
MIADSEEGPQERAKQTIYIEHTGLRRRKEAEKGVLGCGYSIPSYPCEPLIARQGAGGLELKVHVYY